MDICKNVEAGSKPDDAASDGRLCCLGGSRMKRGIWNSLKDNRIAQTKQVGQSRIEAELRGGDVQEAF